MKELTMFYLEDCGYCAKARQALDELFRENPAYAGEQSDIHDERQFP